MIKLNPQTRKKLARFQKIKLGYFSFITLSLIIAFLSVAELFVNSRALIVHYEDTWYFPTYADFILGLNLGLITPTKLTIDHSNNIFSRTTATIGY